MSKKTQEKKNFISLVLVLEHISSFLVRLGASSSLLRIIILVLKEKLHISSVLYTSVLIEHITG